MTQRVEMFGTITSDGTLVLDEPVLLPPGPVLVIITPLGEAASAGDEASQPAESPAEE